MRFSVPLFEKRSAHPLCEGGKLERDGFFERESKVLGADVECGLEWERKEKKLFIK